MAPRNAFFCVLTSAVALVGTFWNRTPTMEAVRREVVGQLEEASERLAEVAHELDVVVVQAARQAGSAEEAEHLKRQAATAIADVARMLRAEGPAAAIAEVSVGRWSGPGLAPGSCERD